MSIINANGIFLHIMDTNSISYKIYDNIINMISIMNCIECYDINLIIVQIYFIYAHDNYIKSHKLADSYIKSYT